MNFNQKKQVQRKGAGGEIYLLILYFSLENFAFSPLRVSEPNKL